MSAEGALSTRNIVVQAQVALGAFNVVLEGLLLKPQGMRQSRRQMSSDKERERVSTATLCRFLLAGWRLLYHRLAVGRGSRGLQGDQALVVAVQGGQAVSDVLGNPWASGLERGFRKSVLSGSN